MILKLDLAWQLNQTSSQERKLPTLKLVDQKYLYNLEVDRIESNDLSKSNPEKFQQMLAEWKKRDAELNKSKKKKKGKKK